jgi:hypothetical protein
MTAAYEELIHLFDQREIGYSTGEGQAIRTDLRGEVATYRVVARVEDDIDLFQVFGYSPLRVPEGCRPAVAETLTRANYGLRIGKFEMDMDDGELRFQVAQILVHDTLGEDVIDRMIGTTINMLDMYLPAVLSVIYANELPQDAVRRVEGVYQQSSPPAANADGDEDDAEEDRGSTLGT